MFNSKFNGLLTTLLIVAILGIVALLGYFGWSVYNKFYLNSNAQDAVDAFEQSVTENKPQNTIQEENIIQDENTGDRGSIGEVESVNTTVNQGGSSNNTYYGYKILGTISIPKIDIKYPILEKATPKAIKVAVAYLTGARSK